jgi:hypothetical protein
VVVAGLAVVSGAAVLHVLFPEAPSSNEGNEHMATVWLAVVSFLYAARVLGALALLGGVAALVGIARRERSRPWAYVGLFVNGLLLVAGGLFLWRIFH